MAETNEPEKQGLHVPVNVIRWIGYSVCMLVLMLPFYMDWEVGEWIGVALITGWHFSLLNEISKK